ncbi:MAG: hypothetical protein K2Q03_00740 [Sphingobacteriaceae bacterium]|nr:hypothetical protein [Sphingobacteriaceae bacterium]
MKRKVEQLFENRPTKKELISEGYKNTEIQNIYVSKSGVLFDWLRNKRLKPHGIGINIDGKHWNVPKLIMKTFKKIEPRNGHICFKNGNNKDFSLENLEYQTTPTQLKPNESDLILCIRLYFQVSENFKKSNVSFKYYLYRIAEKRGLKTRYSGLEFNFFIEYLKTYASKSETRLKYNLSPTNSKNAINKYLKILIDECLSDHKRGILKIMDFLPKPKTKVQKKRDLKTALLGWDNLLNDIKKKPL